MSPNSHNSVGFLGTAATYGQITRYDGKGNYRAWRDRMELVLEEKDLWEVVCGPQSDEEESGDDSDDAGGHKQARKGQKTSKTSKNASKSAEKQPLKEIAPEMAAKAAKLERKARAALYLGLSDKMLALLRGKTAREAWVYLENSFNRQSFANKALIRKKLQSFSKPPNTSISEHVSALESLVTEYLEVGGSYSNEDTVTTLLQSLGPEFEQVITTIETQASITGTQIEMETIFATLLQAEAKIKDQKTLKNTQNLALIAQSHQNQRKGGLNYKKNSNATCHRCSRTGHVQKDCFATHTKNNKPLDASTAAKLPSHIKKCTACSRLGHLEDVCRSKAKETSLHMQDKEYALIAQEYDKKQIKNSSKIKQDVENALNSEIGAPSLIKVRDGDLKNTQSPQPHAQIYSNNVYTVGADEDYNGEPISSNSDNEEPRGVIVHPKMHKKRSKNAQKKPNSVFLIDSKQTWNKTDDSNAWIADSGATSHMCFDKTLFQDDLKPEMRKIIIGKFGDHILSKGIGSIRFKTPQGCYIKMQDVLYTPDLTRNLASIAKMQEKGLRVLFDQGMSVYTQENVQILTGHETDGLYHLEMKPVRPNRKENLENAKNETALIANSRISFDTWHKRLGHINTAYLRKLISNSVGLHVDSNAQDLKNPCEGCIAGKMRRLPFKTSNSHSKVTGELIHGDLSGRLQVQSIGGAQYLALFIDDCSRYAWGFPIRNKDDTAQHLSHLIALIERETGHKVKILRSDGGGEFFGKLDLNLKKLGIRHHSTAPHSSQSNGRVERHIGMIFENVRCLLYQSGLPLKYWAFAAATAIYLHNRTPSSRLEGFQTPYQIYFGEKPDVSHLRTFGCVVYARNTSQIQKLDPRGEPGIFLGYFDDSKAYRVVLMASKRIIKSRDLIFDENTSYSDYLKRKTAILDAVPPNINENSPQIVEIFDNVLQTSNSAGLEQESMPQNVNNDGAVQVQVNQAGIQDQEDDQDQDTESDQASEYHEAFNSPNPHRQNVGLESDDESPQLRRSTRVSKLPGSWWALNAAEILDFEPQSYQEAVSRPDKDKWNDAMDQEHSSLIENATWKLVPRPKHQKPIKSRWVFKIKRDQKGQITRYKARLVARGFSQIPGVDFNETYAPVARYTSLRIVLAIAIIKGFEIRQIDVTTAYLYGKIDEELYMEQPEGYNDKSDQVCRLIKSLYGLKQSALVWHRTLKGKLAELGFKESTADSSIFTRIKDAETTIIVVYVDDMLILGNNGASLSKTIEFLTSSFKITENKADSYLNIKIDYQEHVKLEISQAAYALTILKRFNMQESNPISTPMDKNANFASKHARFSENQDAQEIKIRAAYPKAIGSLMFAMIATRPDIAYAVGMLSRFTACAEESHWTGVKRILRYIQGSKHRGLVYRPGDQNVTLSGYSDASYADDPTTRRSTSGYVFFIGENAVSWTSKRQTIVTLSSTESEYVAATIATQEMVWIRRLLADLGYPQKQASTLYLDNQGADLLAHSPAFHARTKHIDTRFHFIREKVQNGEIQLKHVSTHEQLADIFTKPLDPTKFSYFSAQIHQDGARADQETSI